MEKKSNWFYVLQFPLTRIIIGLTVVVGITALGQFGIGTLLKLTTLEQPIRQLISGITTALLALCSYAILFRYYEKREVTELSFKRIRSNLLLGFALGFALQTLTILVIYLLGGFTIISVNPAWYLLSPLVMAFTSAIFEEVLVRGIIFRILEEKLGSYLALIISALIFGALHLGNPNSSLLAALGLALQAGFFLAVAFMYSRNLWFPIAIHFAWNFTQGGIFGANTSGNVMAKSLLNSSIEGAEWYTGGAFGPEGSVQATVFCFITALVLLRICIKNRRLVPPFWRSAGGNKV